MWENRRVTLDLNPGTAGLGNPRLIDVIIAEMDGGAISFERFMELALYHPEFGYYRRPGRIGRQGDFLTSPAIHPMFGWAVGGWCREIWRRLGKPARFTVIEPGAGEGMLAQAVLDWAEGRDDGFRDALRYVAIEPNNPGVEPRVEWATGVIERAEAGVVVTNELFDALPVRLFDAGARGPIEVLVRWDAARARFVETPGSVATIDDAPAQGRFEVSPRAPELMETLCQLVVRGAVLTIDYGYPQGELWAPWRMNGTLMAFYRHTAHEDPYVHVGEQDLTAHVNFSDLETVAEGSGMAVFGPVSQSEFLYGLGLAQVVEAARNEMAEYFTRRRALEQLTDGAGLGRIRVLAATRDVHGIPPGFEEHA